MTLTDRQLGHYRILNLIGQGGMGEVYLAEDTSSPRQVAVKVIRAEKQPYPDANALQQADRLFQREMKALSLLSHTNILDFHEFGEQPDGKASIFYLVMPYYAEGSLVDWLLKRGPALLAPEDVVYMIEQMALALQYAHDHQIVHQDVKLANFLVRTDRHHPTRPHLSLSDFGIAKMFSATVTASNNMRGTAAYMPPEQWSGEPVPATDQYALAVIAYQLLTGQLPFQGTQEQMMFQHLSAQPKLPSAWNPRLSPAVDAVLLRALAKKAEQRFPTIHAFAVALQQALLSPGVRPAQRHDPTVLAGGGADNQRSPRGSVTPPTVAVRSTVPQTPLPGSTPPPPPPPGFGQGSGTQYANPYTPRPGSGIQYANSSGLLKKKNGLIIFISVLAVVVIVIGGIVAVVAAAAANANRGHNPGPNGSPPNAASGTIIVQSQDFDTLITLIVTGLPDGGTVCANDDDGQPHTQHRSLNNGTSYVETYTSTCSNDGSGSGSHGSYKDGHLTYTSILISDQLVFSGTVTCRLRSSFTNFTLDGTFTSATSISGRYSSYAGTYDCDQGASFTPVPSSGNWTGVAHMQ